MNTDYVLKNFRISDKEGCLIDIRPITIVTGCNNSGKSSIVKSLCLLEDFCRQIEADYKSGKTIRLHEYKLDFHKHLHSALGSFSNILHKSSNENPEKQDVESEDKEQISFEVTVYSSMLMEYVKVCLNFDHNEGDQLDNGYLHSYTIKTENDEIIFSCTRDKGYCMNFTKFKKNILYFIYTQYAVYEWQNEILNSQYEDYIIEEDNKQLLLFKDACKTFVKEFDYNRFLRLLEWHTLDIEESGIEKMSFQPGKFRDKILKDKKIDSTFSKAPKFEILHYFPFMEQISDLSKEEFKSLVLSRIEVDSEIDSIEKLLVRHLLSDFDNSQSNMFLGYICYRENQILFKHEQNATFLDQPFAWPDALAFTIRNYEKAIWEEQIKDGELSYGQLLQTLDVLNELICGYRILYNGENAIHPISSDNVIRMVIEDILLQLLPGKMMYTPTSITIPRRIYALEEQNDFSYLLKTYIEKATHLINYTKKNEDSKIHIYKPYTFLNKWLNEFGVAHHAKIQIVMDGYGASIRLYESENDTKGMALIDKGYGSLHFVALLLKIEIAIIESGYFNIINGYNTSGISKKIVQHMRPYNRVYPFTVALEEPESHLHPSYQSKIAEMLIEAYSEYGIQFIIESHSEYLIRKLQLLVAQGKIDNKYISLLYVNGKNRQKFEPLVSCIGINEDGTLDKRFGSGFYDEAINLSNSLYKHKIIADEAQM